MNSVSDSSPVRGGGIYALYSDNLTISNCTISGNTAVSTQYNSFGGGIQFRESTGSVLTNCIISGNNAYAYSNVDSFGGGVHCESNSNPTFTGCNISDNNADNGGGIYSSGSNPILTDSQVCGNVPADQISGLWTNDGNVCVAETCLSCDGVLEVPSEYATIQSAIDMAIDGDTVLVAPGTYVGDLFTTYVINTLGKAITIRASGSPEETILDGQGTRRVVLHSGAANLVTVIDGFTITGGFTEFGYGGGFGCSSTSTNPTITNCIITGNSSGYRGGGLYFPAGSIPTITNCTISNNTTTSVSSGGGGGLYFENFCDATISNCTITGNTAGFDGGGIYGQHIDTTTFTNCTISDNTANHSGGGIYGYYFDSTLSGCTIENNAAGNEGGGMYYHFSTPDLSNCILSGNNASVSGGGIFCNGNEVYNPTLTQSDVCGNTPDQFSGPWTDGGNVCSSSSCIECFAIHVPADYSTIQKAIDVSVNGDTILVAPGTYTDIGDRVIDTLGKSITILATGTPEETILDGELNRGVIRCVNGEDTNTIIEGFTITRGVASLDGGGGIKCVDMSSPLIRNCIIDDNRADYGGGGVYCYYKCYPVLDGCTVTNNITVYFDGGGIYSAAESYPYLTNTIVCGNEPLQIEGDWANVGGNDVDDECVPDCNGDINDDSVVNIHDLLVLIAAWGSDDTDADLNNNGIVNIEDLLILIAAWGACP